jgi:hypothetical protein
MQISLIPLCPFWPIPWVDGMDWSVTVIMCTQITQITILVYRAGVMVSTIDARVVEVDIVDAGSG